MFRVSRNKVTVAMLMMVILALIAIPVGAERIPSAKLWPKFTMTFTETRFGLGPNGNLGTQQIKLTHADELRWRTEILAHSYAPAVVGQWDEYTGTTLRSYDPRTKQETVNDLSKESGHNIPAEWFSPDYISRVVKNTNAVRLQAPARDQEQIEFTEQYPCSTESQQDVAMNLAACTNNSRTMKRTITYTVLHHIPLKIVDTIDGVEFQTITVDELLLH